MLVYVKKRLKTNISQSEYNSIQATLYILYTPVKIAMKYSMLEILDPYVEYLC